MTTLPTTTVFSTADSHANIPAWASNINAHHAGQTFAEVVDDLQQNARAVLRDAAYRDHETGEWTRSPDNRAVVNPAWEGDSSENAVWQIATTSYEPVNPADAYDPLLTVLADRKTDAGTAAGIMRPYRRGGEVQFDMFFDGIRVSDPDDRDRFVLGLATGYDHFGGTRVYAETIALDTETGAIMRGLGEPRRRRHVGTARAEVVAWWEHVLDQLADASDAIREVILDAMEYEVGFGTLPFGVAEFYEYIGFPDSYAAAAAERVDLDARTRTASGWDLYAAMSTALADECDAKVTGGAFGGHVARTNRILHNPPRMERNAVNGALASLTENTTLADFSPGTRTAVEDLREHHDGLSDAVDQYRTGKDRLRTILQSVEDDGAGDDDEADEAESENAEVEA